MIFPLFSIGNIRVHAQLWALAVPLYCLYIYNWDPLTGLAAAVGVMLSVLIHELGHAVVADRYKLRPQVVLGVIGGYCQHDQAQTDKQDALILIGGPGVQIVAGLGVLVAWVAVALLAPEIANNRVIVAFSSAFLLVSILWGAINLLPIWHLDGGKLYRLGLIHILKFDRVKADKVTHITAIVIGGLLALAFLALGQPYAVLLIGFLVFQNIQRLRSGSAAGPVRRENGLAKELLEDARKAMENGNFREATRLGHQIRAEGNVPDRILAPAWEIIAIGSIADGKIDEGLRFAKRAPQTPKVVAARVKGMLALGHLGDAEALLKSSEFNNIPASLQEQLEREVADAR